MGCTMWISGPLSLKNINTLFDLVASAYVRRRFEKLRFGFPIKNVGNDELGKGIPDRNLAKGN